MPKPANKSTRAYAAFLLGINIGPHKRVPMAELKEMCESMGFTNVRTLLASGNVVFEAPSAGPEAHASEMERQIKKRFGFDAGVIVRTITDLKKMADADPFKKIKVTKDTRRYVTFYTEDSPEKVKTPVQVSDKKGGSFTILAVIDEAVFSVLELGKSHTVDMMTLLGKMFGRKITTRNWNTIEKLLK